MTPQPLQPPPQQPQQQKTFLPVVLLLVFGALACCGGVFALGAYGAYNEAKDKQLAGKTSKTTPTTDSTDTTDDDTGDDPATPTPRPKSEEDALREEFAQEMVAQLEVDGKPGFTYDRKHFRLANKSGELMELTNFFDEYKALEEDQRLAYVEKISAGFGKEDLPDSWSGAKGQVLVTVRDRITLELVPIRTGVKESPLTRPLADDLVQVVVYDGPDNMQYLTQANLDRWGIDADELFLEGKKQLVARSKKPFAQASPGVYESKWADNHDVARALLGEQLKKLKLKGEPLVFLPQRDHLVITGSTDKRGQEAAAELVDTYLALPRANSGRGWVVKSDGTFDPWIPPEGSRFAELRQQALAADANDQKKALDEKFEKDGTDIFVGTTLFTEDDDDKPLTYAVWTKGADTLMPKADFIVLVDIDRPEPDRVIGAAPWDHVVKIAGARIKPDPSYWPLRYRLKTFPDAKQVKAIGLHHFFTRNKNGKDATDTKGEDDESDGD
ncbi:MAG: hypothetical protein QM817_15990 [Archangium sp.]